jgi:hypothetical protein
MSLDALPLEIVLCVTECLYHKDVGSWSSTSRRFQMMLRDEYCSRLVAWDYQITHWPYHLAHAATGNLFDLFTRLLRKTIWINGRTIDPGLLHLYIAPPMGSRQPEWHFNPPSGIRGVFRALCRTCTSCWSTPNRYRFALEDADPFRSLHGQCCGTPAAHFGWWRPQCCVSRGTSSAHAFACCNPLKLYLGG